MSESSVGKSPIRVLIVDDQALVRRGLAMLLGSESRVLVVGEASDGVEALRKLPEFLPDVALVDARMPRMSGIELTERLAVEYPRVAVIILTTFDDDEYVFGGLQAGAKGYLLKDTPPGELISSIQKVNRGETVLGGEIAAKVVSELRLKTPDTKVREGLKLLSVREIQVLKLVGAGATNEEIARRLYITEGTAKNHVSKVLKKLGLRDRTQAALYAAEHEW